MTQAAIFGDVHLDAEGCLREQFFEALSSVIKNVDIIIMNGDFLDNFDENGKKALDAFISWCARKGCKEKIVFVTGGMGHEGNLLYDRPDIQVVPFVKLNTTEGRFIICHGHNIGLKKRVNETWKEAASNLKKQLIVKEIDFLPKLFTSDKLIISHTHVPFYDMDNGVFATGGWMVKEDWTDSYISRNVGIFIVIDDEDRDDPIKLRKRF
ncbi:MAG: metallophosphoesterase [Candidatus Heimdallarchaeota archaeon]